MQRSSHLAAWLARIVLVFAVAWPAGPTSAGEPDAQQQFTAALAEFDAGDYEAALAGFRGAYERSRSPNARLYVGRCLHKLGRLAEAYDELHATMRTATERAQQESKYEQTRDAAAAELAIVEPKIAKLVVAVTESTEGATMELDGQSVEADRIGAPITVEPGEHAVVVRLASGEELSGSLELAAAETKTLTLSPTGSEEGISDPPRPGPAPDESTGGGVRVAGFVIAGLGVAGMVVFGVTGSLAAGEFGTLEDECGDLRCPDPSYADVVDRGKTYETVANVSLVAGIVAIVAGTTMIIFGGPSDSGDESARVELVPNGTGLAVRGAF
ncbi:MAG: CDC27 family protein [Deltaproteobacteria bacterium]|jgi:hypothetical protein|nr:CDC27 family protein [Deltaproteobacteria bacterium]MBW2535343.1 CDC27 family protein [Deltaproteobacteria bacterium]